MKQPDLADLSVVVVDDQRDFLRLFCAILRSFGVRKLTSCQSADEVVQHMRAHRFDMLFADVRMPEVDGVELIRRIRCDEKLLCRGLPIICVSAFSEQSAIQSAIRAGADDFLVKPVRPIDVYKRLASHLMSPLPRIKVPGYFGPDPQRATGPAARHDDELPARQNFELPLGHLGDPEVQSDSTAETQPNVGADAEPTLLRTGTG